MIWQLSQASSWTLQQQWQQLPLDGSIPALPTAPIRFYQPAMYAQVVKGHDLILSCDSCHSRRVSYEPGRVHLAVALVAEPCMLKKAVLEIVSEHVSDAQQIWVGQLRINSASHMPAQTAGCG